MKRSRQLLVALLAMLAWSGATFAQETVLEDFNGDLPEGWTLAGNLTHDDTRAKSGKGIWTSEKAEKTNYMVTAELKGSSTIKFLARTYNTRSYGYLTLYAVDAEGKLTGEKLDEVRTPNQSNGSSLTWAEYTFTVPAGNQRVAIDFYYVALDNMEYTPAPAATEGPGLSVSGDTDGKLEFGMVNPGATKTLTLDNPGSTSITVDATTTGGFTATPSSITIAAKGTETLTIAAPAATATGTVTITPNPAVAGIEPVTVQLSCTVKDPNKMFADFVDNALPEDWTADGNGSYAWSFEEGFAQYTGSYTYAGQLTTPAMIFDTDETLMFDVAGNNAWEPDYGSAWAGTVEIFVSTDGTNFGEAIKSFTDIHYNVWQSCSVTIPAGTKYVRFQCSYANIDNIYGGKIDATPRPRLEVADIANGGELNWGFADVPAGTEKTVTLKNIGKADLKVAFAATDDYTLSATEATIKAGETFDLTIGTPAHDGEGVLTITPAAESGLAVYTISLKSYYKVPKAMMDIQTTKVEFGKVYADAKETITVSNTGDADLTATIASDNEKFVVSAASITVKQGETGTFDITYKYDGTVSGMQTATITVTPNDGSAQKITASANNKKAGVWSEDFEEGIPASWTNDGWTVGYSINDGSDVKRASAGMSNGYLITPRLKAEADEELTFDFIGQWALLKVEWANELEGTWTLYNTYGSTEESTPLTTITFKAPAAGNYYLRFSGSGSYLDNFEGFNLDRLPADAIVKSSSLPATGNQYAEYKASVTIENKGSEAQTAVAQLYFKGEVKDTKEQALAVDGQAKIDLSFIPEEAAEDAEVKIVVTLKGVLGFTKTVEGTVTIAEVETISETAANTFEADKTYVGVRLNYTAKNGWSTIALPFAPTSEQMTQIFGEGWKAYYFNKYNEGVLSFQSTTFIRAGVPFIVYTENAPAVAPVLLNVTITATEASADESNGASFKATYSPIAAPGMEGKWGINDQAKIAKGTAKASINGLRGYFELPAASEARIEFYDGDTVTAIGSIEAVKDQSNDTYNLQGQRINQRTVKKGLYIVNGKKMIVK